MIVEYIGQGINDDPNESTGNFVCSSLKEGAFNDIYFFVAFIRRKGLLELKPFIEQAKKDSKNLTFYVGIDEKITSKEALEMLLELGIEAFVYASKRYIYHPKLYLFEGEFRNRIIIGSSNLTKTGLFYNIEASVLLDFTSEDKSGLKVLNQIKDYYSGLLDFSDENLEKVTPDYISYLLENGLIAQEKYEDSADYVSKTHDDSKQKFKNPKIENLGNIEISENAPIRNYKYIDKITEEYLEKWDSMFERLKLYKAKHGRTTVSKHHDDRTLFGWYQKQKRIHNNPDLKMPQEHIDKLNSIDFYWGDGHGELEELNKRKWLRLLKEAIEAKENISPDHRFEFKGERLGTWLQGAKNDKELKARVEAAGFDYSTKSRDPEDVAQRFVDKLLTDEKPVKHRYQTSFNTYILKKKDVLSDKLKRDIEEAWMLQFNEKREWRKGTIAKDRTEEWKEFRYNKAINPDGKWSTGQAAMGLLYYWVNGKRKSKSKMDLVVNNFTPKELEELKNEGFPIE